MLTFVYYTTPHHIAFPERRFLYKAPKNIQDNDAATDVDNTAPKIIHLDDTLRSEPPSEPLLSDLQRRTLQLPIPSNATDAVATVLFPATELYPATFTDTFLRTGGVSLPVSVAVLPDAAAGPLGTSPGYVHKAYMCMCIYITNSYQTHLHILIQVHIAFRSYVSSNAAADSVVVIVIDNSGWLQFTISGCSQT